MYSILVVAYRNPGPPPGLPPLGGGDEGVLLLGGGDEGVLPLGGGDKSVSPLGGGDKSVSPLGACLSPRPRVLFITNNPVEG